MINVPAGYSTSVDVDGIAHLYKTRGYYQGRFHHYLCQTPACTMSNPSVAVSLCPKCLNKYNEIHNVKPVAQQMQRAIIREQVRRRRARHVR